MLLHGDCFALVIAHDVFVNFRLRQGLVAGAGALDPEPGRVVIEVVGDGKFVGPPVDLRRPQLLGRGRGRLLGLLFLLDVVQRVVEPVLELVLGARVFDRLGSARRVVELLDARLVDDFPLLGAQAHLGCHRRRSSA